MTDDLSVPVEHVARINGHFLSVRRCDLPKVRQWGWRAYRETCAWVGIGAPIVDDALREAERHANAEAGP